MIVTRDTTVAELLEQYPESRAVFARHGVEIEYECPDAVLYNTLDLCEGMCHLDDIDALIHDLQECVDAQPVGA